MDFKIFAARMYYDPVTTKWNSKGWSGVEPAKCRTIAVPTNNKFIFVHGMGSGSIWGEESGYKTCVSSDVFNFLDAESYKCDGEKDRQVEFYKIEVKDKKASYTFDASI